MVENTSVPAPKPPQLSVHIMLPETVDRRLERWTNKLAGASWPAWGGHVTLVPPFIEVGDPGTARTALQKLCSHEEPFQVRFGAPIAVSDATRPDYFAVFLTVDSTDADVPRPAPKTSDGAGGGESYAAIDAEIDATMESASDTAPVEPARAELSHADTDQAVSDVVGGEQTHEPAKTANSQATVVQEQPTYLHRLRQRLLERLAPHRNDVYPQLVEQRFLPHVTLALGLGELEANRLVREIRADPLTVTFTVEVVWLVTQTFGEGARFERDPIPLGRVGPVELMRD